jgi:glycosyltransferase involved in cell wall biosynthesis
VGSTPQKLRSSGGGDRNLPIMQIDIVIPTYNRSASLQRTLRSLLSLRVPDGHRVAVAVCDNNSTDDTPAAVAALQPEFGDRLSYVPATAGQGRSFAINAGIGATAGDVVGFVDDDEEVYPDWAEIVLRAFADPQVDYVGGPYEPVWQCPPPAWIHHPDIRTALGWADFGSTPRRFEEPGFGGLALGGNSVLRRACFARVGLYSEALGRAGRRLLGGEDTEMHERLKAAGLKGLYLPEMRVRHHIPRSRVTRSYMRRWAFWASASHARLLEGKPLGPRWFGAPRYMYGRLARAPLAWAAASLRQRSAEAFQAELTAWRFAGFFYGLSRLARDARREMRKPASKDMGSAQVASYHDLAGS